MKLLKDVLEGISYQLAQGSEEVGVSSVILDSRKAADGSLFIAIEGSVADGHQYISKAIDSGARSIVCTRLPDQLIQHVNYVVVEDTAAVAGLIAANFYNHPSHNLKVIGVTGTNGKTSVVFLARALFTLLGYKVGMLSTVRNQIGDQILDATLTTPDSVSLQALLALMLKEGCTHVFMEVSSHAIHQHRVAGLSFSGGVFTNITHDHLDYHGTFQEYLRVKKSFLDDLVKDAFALVNLDDRNATFVLQNTTARKCTFALRKAATYKGKVFNSDVSGLHMSIDGVEVHSRLMGAFNASNLLAVYGIALELGEEKMEVLEQLSRVSPPPGRMEAIRHESKGISAFVDYAHTPDALKNVLHTLKGLSLPSQKIITVVGCGGDRDRKKRPEMARIACQWSDRVILTSDNPRYEDPERILEDMKKGVPREHAVKVLSITNRREAIRTACLLAPDQSVILVAGKGHENYQEIKGIRTPFDDKEVVQASFADL